MNAPAATPVLVGWVIEFEGRFVGFDETGRFLADDKAEAYVYPRRLAAKALADYWSEGDVVYHVDPVYDSDLSC